MLKNILNYIFKFFGVKIIRYSSWLPLDFTKNTFHPKTLNYLCEQKKAILNLDFEKGRTIRFFSLNELSYDPFLFSLVHLKKKKINERELYGNFLNMILSYKKIIKVENIYTLLGLKKIENHKLNTCPIWALVLPWENISIEQKLLNFPKSVKVDRAKNGFLIKSNDPEEIMKEDQDNSLPSHIRQYLSLINSIKKKGYVPDCKKSYIETELLLKGNEFCWKPSGEGNHRATVVASLGYKTIKSVITKVIRFEDLEYWPNVINGTYNKNEAEQIFNRFFEANPPDFNKDWILYCKDLISRDV